MIKISKFRIYLFLLLFVAMSCASNKMVLSSSESDWKDSEPSSDEIVHSIYLIGDVGGAKMGRTTIPLIELNKQLVVDKRVDNLTDVIFLGDNIYPVGMPPVGHEDRSLAEHRLNVQLEAVRAFEGNVTFVPGNHDWYTYGREGLKRQEQYIETYLSQYNETFTDYFRPSDGCGNVDVLKISDRIAIVSIDSHWYLSGKDEEYDYSDCEIKSRKEFEKAFELTMQELDGMEVMLTMHHPMYTVGAHGGFFEGKSYVFPTTQLDDRLLIPLPMSGTIFNVMRARVSEQDTKSEPYVHYRNAIIPWVKKHGETIVAAGHEHTLQYHKIEGVDYVVSGSGSKKGPVGRLEGTKFAYGNYGYALVDYYANGEVWLAFFASDSGNETFGEVYRSQIR